MKKSLFIYSSVLTFILIFIVCPGISHMCPPPPAPYSPSPILEWSHTYGGQLDDEGRAVFQTPDGGYVIAGTTNSLSDDGLSRAFLFKTDVNGTLRWIKTYGDRGNSTIGYSMVNTSDGGYAITGKSWPKAGNSTGSGEDVYLVKTDSSGNVQWYRHYGGPKNDSGQYIVQSNDGGFAILGYTESYGNGGRDAYLVKTDADGNLLWNRTYGSKKDDVGYYLMKTGDGGYAITGRIMSDATSAQSNHFVYLIKTDSNGTIVHETGYTDPDSTICYSILNGSFSVAMNELIHNHIIAFTDNDGSKPAGYPFVAYEGRGDSIGYSSIPFDYGQITVGYTESFGKGMKDVYLLKSLPSAYLQQGGLQWEQTYGGEKDDIGYSIASTNDGGQIIVGSTDSFGYGGKDVYLLKIKYNGTGSFDRGSCPTQNSTKDNPQMTDWAQLSSTPAPSISVSSIKTTPSMAYFAIPIIFIVLAIVRKIKI